MYTPIPTSYPTLYPTLQTTQSLPDSPTLSPTLHPVYTLTTLPWAAPSLSHSPTSAPLHCTDGFQNGDEADIDCSGGCEQCGLGSNCRDKRDCFTGGDCQQGTCVAAPFMPTTVPTTVFVTPVVLAVVQKTVGRIDYSPGIVGDGQCDHDVNSVEFDFDGGDCCVLTCTSDIFNCQDGSFNCKDPVALQQEVCPVKNQKNGKCNTGIHNTLQCGYDSGDCCRDTCTGARCLDPGMNGGWHHCKDPASEQLRRADVPEQGIVRDGCSAPNMTKLGDGHCDLVLPHSLQHHHEHHLSYIIIHYYTLQN